MPAAKGRTVVLVLAALAVLAAVALPAGASIPRPGQLHAPNPGALLVAARDTLAPKETTSRDTRFEIFAGSTDARYHLDLQAAADARFHLLTPRETRVRGFRLPEPLLIGIELPPSRTAFRLYGDVPDRFASEGLYITEDPLGYVDGPNLYQYGLNNPVNFSDPLGLATDEEEKSCLDSLGAAWDCATEPLTRLWGHMKELAKFHEEHVASRRDPRDTGLQNVATEREMAEEIVVRDLPEAALRVSDVVAAKGLITVGFRVGERIITKQVAERHLPELLGAGWEIVDDDVAEAGVRHLSRGELLARFDTLARRARVTDEFLSSKVLRVHGPGSTIPGKSRFIEGFDVRKGIRSTLDSAESLILPNTEDRPGAIFIREFGKTIGTNARGNPVTRLKVVLGDDGQLITAFPIR